MKNFRRFSVVTITLLVCFTFVTVTFAHPLGNFTINQYAGLQISRDRVVIDYVVDMAEIPAFQEISAFDADGNGQADSTEAAGYHEAKCASLQPNLSLLLNKKAVYFALTSSSVEFPVGVGGLPTLRLTCEFQAPLNITDNDLTLSFTNKAYPDRPGWKEIVIIEGGVTLQGEFSSTSLSQRLTNYPQDLLTNPPDQRQVEFAIIVITPSTQNEAFVPAGQTNAPVLDRNDAFTRLILLEETNFWTFLLAIVIAFIWGAMHALTPGHGKTIVGAYLVGSRGTRKHALYLGLTTTITHTLGVFALGLVTLFAAQYILPETLYPWMTLLSGLFVAGIGINLFASRFRSSGLRLPGIKVHFAGSGHAHSLAFQPLQREARGRQHQHALNGSGKHLHIHDYGRAHVHRHDDHVHGLPHDHNQGDHSHLPPGVDGSPVTWRSLLALGISGGLIPCPSALVVLLGAIALNKIGFGLILVLAFSLGLAGALTAIGMLFIYAGRLFERVPSQGKIIRFLPVLSALIVSLIGAAIIWKALGDITI
jgi:ABC-type nickel/cobalt efflux system permease component RcnA